MIFVSFNVEFSIEMVFDGGLGTSFSVSGMGGADLEKYSSIVVTLAANAITLAIPAMIKRSGPFFTFTFPMNPSTPSPG
jgi:hypothetical protein